MTRYEEIESRLKTLIDDIAPELKESAVFVLNHLKSRRRQRKASNIDQLYYQLKSKGEIDTLPVEAFKEVFIILAEIGAGEIDESTRDLRFLYHFETQSIGSCALEGGVLKQLSMTDGIQENRRPMAGNTSNIKEATEIFVSRSIQLSINLGGDRSAQVLIPEDLTSNELNSLTSAINNYRRN